MGPFCNRPGTDPKLDLQIRRSKYRIHVKIDQSRSTFYPSGSIFFLSCKRAFSLILLRRHSMPQKLTIKFDLQVFLNHLLTKNGAQMKVKETAAFRYMLLVR